MSTEESPMMQATLKSEGSMRKTVSEALEHSFLSSDINVVREQLEEFFEHHEDLHRAMAALEVTTALSVLFGSDQEKIEQARAEMQALVDVHLAVEWFELNILDHFHRLRGDGDDHSKMSAEDAKMFDHQGERAPAAEAPTPAPMPGMLSGGFAMDAMVRAYQALENPTQFEQQAYLELLRIAGQAATDTKKASGR